MRHPYPNLCSVRSFDNMRSETIQFSTPLTLIVGYNGSGKTVVWPVIAYGPATYLTRPSLNV